MNDHERLRHAHEQRRLARTVLHGVAGVMLLAMLGGFGGAWIGAAAWDPGERRYRYDIDLRIPGCDPVDRLNRSVDAMCEVQVAAARTARRTVGATVGGAIGTGSVLLFAWLLTFPLQSSAYSPAPASRDPEKATAPDRLAQPELKGDPWIEESASAIARLAPGDPTQWTRGGVPKMEAIEALLGRPVKTSERDAAWALHQARSRRSLPP